ncbi:MAG TPA: NfeD family protein [Myxococcota bacterium]|nr:NfeD family protein [Myxococcota bacterium]
MAWWVWFVLGFILLGGEVVTPGGFYLLFFGFGALCVGLLGLVGLAGPVWGQWFLFTLFSVLFLVLVRPRFLGRLRTPEGLVEDTLVGEFALVQSAIAPGALGRGELRGSTWTLSNAGSVPLQPGDRCRVERVEGLTLHVRK